MSDDPIAKAETLIAKCFGEYKEEIPQREIMNGFAMLPGLVADIKRLREESETRRKLGSDNATALRVGDSNLFVYGSDEATYQMREELYKWQKIAVSERAEDLGIPSAP